MHRIRRLTGSATWAACSRALAALLALAAAAVAAAADDVTFFSFSDIHYGADNGGKSPPMTNCPKVELINTLAGTPWPTTIGGTVGRPVGLVMQGDLINDGAVPDKCPVQWANYAADFGVRGEGRCKLPVFEGIGNHDLNEKGFVWDRIRERNAIRLDAGMIGAVSSNGLHYSWDWGGIHFVNVNLFPGNAWEGEADAYGRAHDPRRARDFLTEDLRAKVGDSGRPVIVVHHFRPIDENWWTYAAADRYQRVLQDYNVVAILVGHQGGGVNNVWRGINWISSNGELVACRIGSNEFVAVSRSEKGWGAPLRKPFFRSYGDSGLPAVVNNGAWASNVTASSATLSGRLLYGAEASTEITAHWGTTDGGTNAAAWDHATPLGTAAAGAAASAAIAGLQPWTTYYYRCRAANAKGGVWAAASVPFPTPGLLPEGWTTATIGYEQRPGGGAHVEQDVFTVRGSGRDIGERGERSDNAQFAWRAMEGDGEIRARIVTAEAKSREPKVGIMLRESPEAAARHVALLLMPKTGLRLVSRKTADGPSSTTILADVKAAPCWVKLVRAGATFTGFRSDDGATWTAVGAPVTLDLPAKLCAGLAVTAGNRDESKLHTSTFDHVTISGPGSAAR